MTAPDPLSADDLCWMCDTALLPFKTTAELEPLEETIGQRRAIEAIEFALATQHRGYNIFAMGPQGIDKSTIVRRLLKREAESRGPADDWCYVSNFDDPRQPKAFCLPPGQGKRLRNDLARFVGDVGTTLRNAFENDEYRTRRQLHEEALKERQEQAVAEVEQRAAEQQVLLVRGPTGIAFAPMREGQALQPDAFQQLADEEKKRIQEVIENLQKELQQALRHVPGWIKETREKVRKLDEATASSAISYLIDSIKSGYPDLESVQDFLGTVHDDIVESIETILQVMEESKRLAEFVDHPLWRRYLINLLIDHSDKKQAPIVEEDDPNLEHLVGRVDHRVEKGNLVTDFSMIRPGALHLANGGYLVLDAQKLLTRPHAYEALKRSLDRRQIRIRSATQTMGLPSAQALEPQSLPLETKVVLVGERQHYYTLARLDPEFSRFFKVVADFEERVTISDDTPLDFARMITSVVRQEDLPDLSPGGVAEILRVLARTAGDNTRMATNVELIGDLLREAAHWSRQGDSTIIDEGHVRTAVASRRRRLSRIEEVGREQIVEGTMQITTSGAKVGQINGLAVSQIGGLAFGKPSRITARVRIGTGQLVDIEREVKLGGPLHSKGVLILSSYLSATFARDIPLSLSASLVFEQNYGGVDGDSASAAELFTLLSALSDLPIHQGIAVTGSVNQHGEVQAIGGANEKIEGFFDLCAERGLDKNQGVIIPATNRRHLVLEQRVLDAVAAGDFHIYAIEHVDQGIELLTKTPAGSLGDEGQFPANSVNAKVAERLKQLAETRRAFGQKDHSERGDDGEP